MSDAGCSVTPAELEAVLVIGAIKILSAKPGIAG